VGGALRPPSRTAGRAALLRAAHQLLDRPPILDDPIAIRLVDVEQAAALRADPRAFDTPAARRLRTSIAIRSRYAEDSLADAVRRGVRRYVILGAGLDSFAYRNPFPDLRVYEVDAPATQAWKRQRLRDAGLEPPGSLTFVPVDFETERLAEAMRRAGIDAREPTFISWLGVTVYLTREAVMDTLAWVASLASGSEIVFGYAIPPSSLGERGRAAVERIAARAAAAGEPWRTFFEPAVLRRDLERLGFSAIDEMTPEYAFERYLRDRVDGLRTGNAFRLTKARR
jgi:methyltransferase (TIGR00027 family)